MTESQSDHQALDSFIVDNLELEKLDARLSSFNIFDVLRATRTEIRHSNILGWLLTPGESHGLGSDFLRRFFTRVLMSSESTAFEFSAAQIQLMDLGDTIVHREWKNIDLFAFSYAKNWCLLIENKVYSKESDGQLLRYLATARDQFPHAQIAPVYLTLEGEDPSNDALDAGYMTFAYSDILEILEQLIEQQRRRIPDDARVLLDHYIETLKRLTMQDTELAELCKSIYRKHRQAIDLIVEYGAASDISEALEFQVSAEVDCEFTCQKKNSAWFLPSTLGKSLPSQETSWKFLPRQVPLMCRVGLGQQKQNFYLIIEIGPMDDSAVRLRLAQAVQKAGFKVGKKALSGEARYTRILRVNHKPIFDQGEPDYSPEAIHSVVSAMWKKVSKDVDLLAEILEGFDWE